MRTLFGMIEDTKDDFDTQIEMSMVEVYNENIQDLLSEDYANRPPGGLRLLENEKSRVRIDKVTLKKPASAEEVMDLILLGNSRRSTSYTESNSESSRSHAVLQITVSRGSKRHEVDMDTEVVQSSFTSATLSIIDLAGSERASATKNLGARMKEGAKINLSLFTLASCITALCQQRPTIRTHVPYRNSKLTRLLQFSLGGNCRTVMIVCVSPSSKDIEESNNTLLWADRAKQIKMNVSRVTGNSSLSAGAYLKTIAELNARIRELDIKVNNSQQAVQSEHQLKRIKAARDSARLAEVSVEDTIQLGTAEIVAGARLRSLWDAAEMRKDASRKRIAELEGSRGEDETEKEIELLESLIRQVDTSFHSNRQVEKTVRNEALRDKSIRELVKTTLEKTFGGDVGKEELENVKLRVQMHEKKLEAQVATAREIGYREGASQQSESFVKAIGVFGQLIASLRGEAEALSIRAKELGGDTSVESAANRLHRLSSTTDTELQAIFGIGDTAPRALPPLPQGSLSTQASTSAVQVQPRGLLSRDGSLGSIPAPARRMSLAFKGRSFSGDTSLSIAPMKSALRKIKEVDARPSSPTSRVGSPARKVPRHVVGKVAVKARTPRKKKGNVGWPDEEGGELVETKEYSLSSGGDASGNQGSADEETEEEQIIKLSPPKFLTGSPMKSTKPTPMISLPRTSLFPLPAPLSINSVPSTSKISVDPANAAVPDWKKQRMGMHGRSNLASMPVLTEESENSSSGSSPDSGPSKQPLLTKAFGSLSRASAPRSPLATLGQFQPRSTNSPPSSAPTSLASLPTAGSSFFASNLSKPTAASLARAADYKPLDQPKSTANRRTSGAMRNTRRPSILATSGPYRSTDRPNRRMSHIPQTAAPDVSITLPPSSGLGNPLLGGAQRAMGIGAAPSPPKGENRRGSMMPAMSGGSLGRAAAGRASIGGARMGSLGTMPSFSNLRGLTGLAPNAGMEAGNSNMWGIAGAGDTSVRPTWR
jgi:kinesin family protein 18/19